MQAETVVNLARRELGVREEPAGSNRVKYNTAYYGREVSGAAYPWCCVFLWWLFREAGASELFYGGGKTASCNTLVAYARAHKQYRTAGRPGDLVFLRFSGTAIEHIGLVERVLPDGRLITIEGNTGTSSDANGGQVQRRQRSARQAVGFYRPDYEEDAMTQEQFNARMDAWLQSRAAAEPSAFSEEARAWAEGLGLIRGSADGKMQYKSFCTREQMLVFLYRLWKMK